MAQQIKHDASQSITPCSTKLYPQYHSSTLHQWPARGIGISLSSDLALTTLYNLFAQDPRVHTHLGRILSAFLSTLLTPPVSKTATVTAGVEADIARSILIFADVGLEARLLSRDGDLVAGVVGPESAVLVAD